MGTPARATLSRLVGWIADRRIPRPLRAPVYRSYAHCTGADLAEVLEPLPVHASLSEFFVRRLKAGARPIDPDPGAIVSPCDGTLQAADRIERGGLLQAKGRPYRLGELLGSEEDAAACEGGYAWTIYLSPRDYHRVHVPEACGSAEVRWIPGTRYSVAPRVLDRRLVLPVNERAVFRLRTPRSILWMTMVGATNVGRIRLARDLAGASFRRGEEIARFEMGSTVVLVLPRDVAISLPSILTGSSLRLGQPLARWLAPAGAARS